VHSFHTTLELGKRCFPYLKTLWRGQKTFLSFGILIANSERSQKLLIESAFFLDDFDFKTVKNAKTIENAGKLNLPANLFMKSICLYLIYSDW
jgi:hypothetical protein